MNELLNKLIEDRFKGIIFKEGIMSAIIGILPHKMDAEDFLNSEWSLVYEREDEPGSRRMVLWMYDDDYDYFSSMIPLREKQIKDAVKHWFEQKTKLKVDLVNVQ